VTSGRTSSDRDSQKDSRKKQPLKKRLPSAQAHQIHILSVPAEVSRMGDIFTSDCDDPGFESRENPS
jgi:hypothetical protein